MASILLREMKNKDFKPLKKMVWDIWYQEIQDKKIAMLISELFLMECLMDQTFIRVAVVDGITVGAIMGSHCKTCRASLNHSIHFMITVMRLLFTQAGRFSLKKIFQAQNVNKKLLKNSKYKYDGEVSFFAVESNYRGLGIGGALFNNLMEYMRQKEVQKYYLFTDTTCNFKFYENRGLKKRSEELINFELSGQAEAVSFFLYDNLP